MDHFRGFKLLRQDPEWVSKLAIASLFIFSAGIIPLLGQILLQGWYARVFRHVARGEGAPLPPIKLDMDSLGKLLGAGIKPTIVAIVWQIPIMFVVLPLLGVTYAGLIIALTSNQGDEVVLGALVCFGVALVLLVPLLMLLTLPLSVAMVRSELADDFGPGFQVGEILAFTRKNLGTLFRASLVHGLVGFFVGLPIGLLTCFIGMYPIIVVLSLCGQVVYADVYRKAVEEGMAPWPTHAG